MPALVMPCEWGHIGRASGQRRVLCKCAVRIPFHLQYQSQFVVFCLSIKSGTSSTHPENLYQFWPYGCGSKPMVPFRGGCTTHFRTDFSGDWDVHWGRTGILTHGHIPRLVSRRWEVALQQLQAGEAAGRHLELRCSKPPKRIAPDRPSENVHGFVHFSWVDHVFLD